MNKICTSIEQSNKLLSLGLDSSTADMCWCKEADGYDYIYSRTVAPSEERVAWSLSALLELMPATISSIGGCYRLTIDKEDNVYNILYDDILLREAAILYAEYSLIDAAFEMVCWLIEQGYISKQVRL